MLVSHEPDLPSINQDESTSDYDDLRESYDALREAAVELEQELEEAQRENRDLRKAVERMKQENKSLKSTPNFVASVEEILEDKVIIKKHGDNQVFMTKTPPQINLKAGDRVSLNKSMSVVEKIETKDTDSRAKAMQVDGEPDVSYEDIGGLDEELLQVRETVEHPLLHPERFDNVGIEPPSGVLLHGSPGTGKTLMAKAVANKTDATFLKLAASELAQKFIGEGSRLVRDLFEVADENSPTVIFIDEIDAIAAKRNRSKSDGGAEVQRTLMQLLSEMDGFDDRNDIRIIAATNRFDMLDDAILRPGRFDRIIEVPPPEAEGRKKILQIHTRDINLDDDVGFQSLSDMTEGFTGADIQATCTEAGMNAVRDGRSEVTNQDFIKAVEKIQTEDSSATRIQGYQ